MRAELGLDVERGRGVRGSGAFVAVWPSVQQSGQGLPWVFLGGLWLTVLGFGVLVCGIAVVGAVRGRLMETIRQE